jgi:hypothetical protein
MFFNRPVCGFLVTALVRPPATSQRGRAATGISSVKACMPGRPAVASRRVAGFGHAGHSSRDRRDAISSAVPVWSKIFRSMTVRSSPGALSGGTIRHRFDCCAASSFLAASQEGVKTRLPLKRSHVCFRQVPTWSTRAVRWPSRTFCSARGAVRRSCRGLAGSAPLNAGQGLSRGLLRSPACCRASSARSVRSSAWLPCGRL